MRCLILPMTALAAATAACTPTPMETARAAASAATQQEKLAKELAGLVPGKPVNCISQFQSQQVSSYGPTILYKVSGSLIYRSETAGGCGSIGRGDILVTRTSSGQLCSGDIARTINAASRFPTGSCSFGDFVPYRKP